MRGTQGSFINRLIERLKRRLKLRKLKKQQIIEDKQILVKKEEERKKKKIIKLIMKM